jgi:hypothetical protein
MNALIPELQYKGWKLDLKSTPQARSSQNLNLKPCKWSSINLYFRGEMSKGAAIPVMLDDVHRVKIADILVKHYNEADIAADAFYFREFNQKIENHHW